MGSDSSAAGGGGTTMYVKSDSDDEVVDLDEFWARMSWLAVIKLRFLVETLARRTCTREILDSGAENFYT